MHISQLEGPKGLPILGSIVDLKRGELHHVLEGWAREFGSAYRLQVGRSNWGVISDPEMIREILKQRPSVFRRRSIMEQAAAHMGINGIFTADGAHWKTQRALTNVAFDQARVEGYLPHICDVGERLVNRWQRFASDEPVDVKSEIKSFTIDLMSRIVFGYDINTLDDGDNPIQDQLDEIFPIFNKRINSPAPPLWKYFPFLADRRLNKNLRKVRALFQERIEASRAEIDPDLPPKNLLEAMLLENVKEGGAHHSDDDIFANLFSILLAGEDAVALTLAWAVHFITHDEDLQKKLHEEIAQAPDVLELALKNRGTLISSVILETTRLKPVAPMISAQAKSDGQIGHINFQKDDIFLLLVRDAALRDDHFSQAEDFMPERWMENAAQCPVHNGPVAIAYGSGPRLCSGRSLSLLEMRVALIYILKSFQLRKAAAGQVPQEKYAFLMAPADFDIFIAPVVK